MLFVINHVLGVRDLIQLDTLIDMVVILTARWKSFRLMLIILMVNLIITLKSLGSVI